MGIRAMGVIRAAALIASCVAPGALVAYRPSACAGCDRPRSDAAACGPRAGALGDVTGGCVGVPRWPVGRGAAAPVGGLPQLPVAGPIPVTLGATPALPRLAETGGAPELLPGGLPTIHTESPPRMLPGLVSIPVVRPVPADAIGPRERNAERQLGALALGGLLAASSGAVSAIRRHREGKGDLQRSAEEVTFSVT